MKNSHQKKVYFYVKDLDITSGGSLYSVLTLMEGLEKEGFQLKIIVNKRKPKEVSVKYPVIPINASLGDLNRHFVLRKILKRENPDFVFSNILTQNVTLSLAKGLFKRKIETKCIGIVRDASSYEENKGLLKILNRLWIKAVYENLDCIIAVSKAVKKDILKAFFLREDKVKVIYNPFNIEKIRNLASEDLPEEHRYIFEKYKVIINVGRLSPQKRHDLLIKSFYRVKKSIPDTKLVIIGMCGVKRDFENEKKLKNLIKELNLEKDVYFLGFQKNPFKYVKRAKIFVLTSQHEGLPRVVIESLAVGTPVIAFKSEYVDTTEIFGENYETLVPFPDTEKLADKIIKIIKDKNLYEKLKKDAEKIAHRFSLENSLKQYIDLMENISKGKKC